MYQSFARGYFQEIVAKVYPIYEGLLRDHDALDFDDLMIKVIELFRKNPEVLASYQDKFQYVLIDEYQDTNEAQYQLTKLLGGKTRNICIVGDFSQSIYSFRGADFRNLEKFKKDYPEIKIVQEKYAGPTKEDAIKSANELLSANPVFQGVFACNESSAVGMLIALQEKGLAGKVKFVGFDTAKVLIEAVEKGEILALAAQNPRMIGSEGVTQAIYALEDPKKVVPAIEFQAVMKDKATLMRDDEIRKQTEADAKREAENKRILEEAEKENAAKLKAFEEEQKKSKETLAQQEIEEKKREAELEKLKAANDAQNAEKVKEIEAAQKKYREDFAAGQAADVKREAELKAMKEEFDRKAEEKKKELEARQKAEKK